MQPNEPGVYCRISAVRAWIDSTMTGAKFCPNGANASSRYRSEDKAAEEEEQKEK